MPKATAVGNLAVRYSEQDERVKVQEKAEKREQLIREELAKVFEYKREQQRDYFSESTLHILRFLI